MSSFYLRKTTNSSGLSVVTDEVGTGLNGNKFELWAYKDSTIPGETGPLLSTANMLSKRLSSFSPLRSTFSFNFGTSSSLSSYLVHMVFGATLTDLLI